MTEQEQKRAKEIEDMLNASLYKARLTGEIPSPITLGLSQVFFCTNSEQARRYRERVKV